MRQDIAERRHPGRGRPKRPDRDGRRRVDFDESDPLALLEKVT